MSFLEGYASLHWLTKPPKIQNKKKFTRQQDQLEKVWEKNFPIPIIIQIFLKISYSELDWSFTYFKHFLNIK